MDADIRYDGFRYTLHFEHGENVGGLNKEPYGKKATGSRIRWKPDIKVFTDIDVPADYYTDIIKRQAIVNAGVKFIFKNEVSPRKFETTEFCYENGILDHVRELAGEDALTSVQFWQSEKRRSATLSITTIPRGWNTAARRTRPCRMRSCTRLTRI